jgi:hypothetical protein
MSMADGIDDIRIDSIGDPELSRLIAAGEPGGVEFKVIVPKKDEGLAPTFAAFANSRGGWLLLGVDDDRRVCGFDVPGNAQAHDWLRDHLQAKIDPLPEFRTAAVTRGPATVTVVRIPQSAATPHVLKRTGVVYERSSGSSRPIDSQSKLLSLCQRPADAEREALGRLTQTPRIRSALASEMTGPTANGQTRIANWYVAATPLGAAPELSQHMLRGSSVKSMELRAAEALRALSESERDLYSATKALGNAYEIEGSSLTTRDQMTLTVDGLGVAAARWSTRLFRGTQHLPAVGDDILMPLLRLVVAALQTGEADGSIQVHGSLLIRSTDASYAPILTVWAAGESGEVLTETPHSFAGRLASPSEEEMRRLTDAWWRELGRVACLELWEA